MEEEKKFKTVSSFLLAPGMLVIVIIVISACNELDCDRVLVVDNRV